jgi:hypothetical protein
LKRVIPLLFILIGCTLLTGGAGLLGTALLYHPADVPGAFDWKAPLEQVDNTELSPATVLLPLTGMDTGAALNVALDNANLENAFALVAFETNLDSPTRIGVLLQLASRYATAKQTRKAAACFQAAALLATLTPALADPAREDTYLQASSGLRALGATEAARLLIDQAYIVAEHSNALRREARARRLNQVGDAYAELGANALAAQAHSKADDALTEPAISAPVQVRQPFNPTLGQLPASEEINRYTQTRTAAAQQLADDLTNNPPKTSSRWPQDSVSQLRDALVDEDGARQSYYDQQIAIAKDPAVQAALWRDRANWLMLKYRAARGAFGIDLVPDWTKDAHTISADLADALDQLYLLQEAQAVTLPKPQDVLQATEDVVRRELIASRWGWLNSASEPDLRDKLSQVTKQSRDAQTTDLLLDTLTRSNRSIYFLLPDELYGMNEQALPK